LNRSSITVIRGREEMEKISVSEFKAKCLGILEEVYRKKKRMWSHQWQ